ncbi:MAG: acyltransferase, partial [Butyrivibrio sp.]|nr:acyltransferase [Butyrivibrio sp.]
GGEAYPFKRGGCAVEFFFIVSGYFMCAHAMKQKPSDGLKNIGGENIGFAAGKIKTVLPAYLYAWLLAFVLYIYRIGLDVLKNDGLRAFLLKTAYALPNLLLLDMGGIKGTEVLGVSWYVSAMLIVMFITYPMLRKWGRNYCLIAAPLIALLLSGFYSSRFGGVYHGRYFWTGIMNHGLMRGFISINIGCFAYTAAEYIKNKLGGQSGAVRTLIRAAEPAAYLCAIALMHYGDDGALNIINILLFAGVSVTMSGQSFFARICDNGACRFMGRLSLWIYFCQSPARMLVREKFPDCSYNRAFVLIVGLTALITAAGMGVSAIITKHKNGGKL